MSWNIFKYRCHLINRLNSENSQNFEFQVENVPFFPRIVLGFHPTDIKVGFVSPWSLSLFRRM